MSLWFGPQYRKLLLSLQSLRQWSSAGTFLLPVLQFMCLEAAAFSVQCCTVLIQDLIQSLWKSVGIFPLIWLSLNPARSLSETGEVYYTLQNLAWLGGRGERGRAQFIGACKMFSY